MADVKFKRVYRKFTKEERARHEKIREQVKRDMPRLNREALVKFDQMEAAFAAMQKLKARREALGLSLGQLAERTGIDKSNLAKLEKDINANPTVETLQRIARALGGTIELAFREAA
jgi:DNA-binding XRE family transcriptional regulator